MNHAVRSCPVPKDSAIARLVPGSHFHDAYAVAVEHPERKALDHMLGAMRATPRWVDMLMNLRNRVVALFGLKHLGGLGDTRGQAATSFAVGERVGIFTMLSQTDDEVLVEDDDKHLRVVVSLRRLAADGATPARVVMTTVVHIHNTLGRLYMLPVGPMHKLIAPAVLARINDARPTQPPTPA